MSILFFGAAGNLVVKKSGTLMRISWTPGVNSTKSNVTLDEVALAMAVEETM